MESDDLNDLFSEVPGVIEAIVLGLLLFLLFAGMVL